MPKGAEEKYNIYFALYKRTELFLSKYFDGAADRRPMSCRRYYSVLLAGFWWQMITKTGGWMNF